MRNSICVTVSCILLIASAPLPARTAQGDRYLAEGYAYEARKQWDAALVSYRLALVQDPAELLYQMAAEKAAFQAAEAHITLGKSERAQGHAVEAITEFERAHALAPALAAASQELDVTREMIRRQDHLTLLERMKQD